MPSRLSWSVMGGPTAHPTGVTLASGDPSNGLTARWDWSGSCPLGVAASVFVLEAVRGRWCVLAGEGGVGGPDGQGSWTQSGPLLRRGSSAAVVDPSDGGGGGGGVEWWFLAVVLVEVTSGSGRRRLSGCSSWSGDSGQGGDRWIRSFVSSDLLVALFKVFLEHSDLILHHIDQALHLGVRLFLEDFFDPPSGCDDFFHCSVT